MSRSPTVYMRCGDRWRAWPPGASRSSGPCRRRRCSRTTPAPCCEAGSCPVCPSGFRSLRACREAALISIGAMFTSHVRMRQASELRLGAAYGWRRRGRSWPNSRKTCPSWTCKSADLAESLRPGQWGGHRLRRALELADGRAESWWEIPLRLLHVWAGVDVVPQYEVRDARGNLIARGDLWIVGTRRLHEYDGGHHDRPETRRVDLYRDKALARIDWERYGYVSTDLVRGADRIVRDEESALGLPHRPTRLERWHAEVARSTLSGRGRAALARRLARFDRR